MIAISKNPLFLGLPYLGSLLLQTKTKLENISKVFSNILVVFTNQHKLSNAFHFKDHIHKEHTSSVVDEFHDGFCNEFNYGEL